MSDTVWISDPPMGINLRAALTASSLQLTLTRGLRRREKAPGGRSSWQGITQAPHRRNLQKINALEMQVGLRKLSPTYTIVSLNGERKKDS